MVHARAQNMPITDVLTDELFENPVQRHICATSFLIGPGHAAFTPERPNSFPMNSQLPSEPIAAMDQENISTPPGLNINTKDLSKDFGPKTAPVNGKFFANKLKNKHVRNRSTEFTHSRTKSDGDEVDKKTYLYKTELCRSWEETGTCRYGNKCQFAHSESELRTVERHPKYKTEMCRTFWEKGTCPYGKRCCFIHTDKDEYERKQLAKGPLAIRTNLGVDFSLHSPRIRTASDGVDVFSLPASPVDIKSSFAFRPDVFSSSLRTNYSQSAHPERTKAFFSDQNDMDELESIMSSVRLENDDLKNLGRYVETPMGRSPMDSNSPLGRSPLALGLESAFLGRASPQLAPLDPLSPLSRPQQARLGSIEAIKMPVFDAFSQLPPSSPVTRQYPSLMSPPNSPRNNGKNAWGPF